MSFSRTRPNDSPNAQSFSEPADVTIDPVAHRLYAVDRLNSRVLVFNLSTGNELSGGVAGHERVADFVIGQPDFQGSACSAGATGLCNPQRALVDPASNRLYVASSGQNRVMVYDTTALATGMAAMNVIGQADFSGTGAATSATALADPWGLAASVATNRLWVVDRGNHRVLGYDVAALSNGPAAQVALGQASFTASGGATTAAGLRTPSDVAWDEAGGRLFVADTVNNRVMVFAGTLVTGVPATQVLGQGDFGSSAVATTQAGFNAPVGLAFSGGKLFVGDQLNNRVLTYKTFTTGSAAFTVFGQASFTTGGGAGGIIGLGLPGGVDAVGGRLWVADSNNHRVVELIP
jgi:DNA-binding beta-propeller fold protein YncE